MNWVLTVRGWPWEVLLGLNEDSLEALKEWAVMQCLGSLQCSWALLIIKKSLGWRGNADVYQGKQMSDAPIHKGCKVKLDFKAVFCILPRMTLN